MSGASRLIIRNRPFILFEHGRKSSAHFGWPSEQLYDFLTARCGLRVSRVEDWLNGRRPLAREDVQPPAAAIFLAHP